MKQIMQNFRSGELKVFDLPTPLAQPGFVVVQNLYSLVSVGTEKISVGLARNSLVQKALSRPDQVKKVLAKAKTDGPLNAYKTAMARLDEWQPMGYSSAGRVLDVGEGVTDLKVGDLVACAGANYANHAEFIRIPRNLVAPIPSNVDLKQAAFTTLGAIAMQGIRRAQLSPGESVAVIGLGLLGQLTIMMLRSYNFPVLGIDLDERQVALARSMGFLAANLKTDDVKGLAHQISNGRGIDAVIITASTPSNDPVNLAGELCRDRGRVSAVGLVGMDIPRRVYYDKELDFLISRSYGPGRYDESYEEKGHDFPIGFVRWTENRNMVEFLRLISSGMDLAQLITHSFQIDSAVEVYSKLVSKETNEHFLGVLFEYSPDSSPERIIHLKRGSSSAPQRMNKVEVGVIGVGSFAREVLLPALKKIDGVGIRALSSSSGRSVSVDSERYGASYYTTDPEKIISDQAINLVVIATRHNLHAQLAIEALRAGKDVFVEKPLAMNEDELRNVLSVAQETGNRLMVGYNRRFSPLAEKIRQWLQPLSHPYVLHYRINAGYIPRNHWVHDPHEGGGRIIGEVCHFVDLLQYFTDSIPVTVQAQKVDHFADSDLDDNISATMQFVDRSIGSILYTAMGSKTLAKEYVEIFASGNAITLDNFKADHLWSDAHVSHLRRFSQDKGHLGELQAFVSAIKTGKPSPLSLGEMAATSLTTFAIVRALQSNQQVAVEKWEF